MLEISQSRIPLTTFVVHHYGADLNDPIAYCTYRNKNVRVYATCKTINYNTFCYKVNTFRC